MTGAEFFILVVVCAMLILIASGFIYVGARGVINHLTYERAVKKYERLSEKD